MQGDPIGLRGGVNRYAYVLLNPVNLKDLLGLDVWQCDVPLGFLNPITTSMTGGKNGPDEDWNPLHHQYLCVLVDGEMICGGQDRGGSAFGGPGKKSNDRFNLLRCKKIRSAEEGCIERCLKGKIESDERPNYHLLSSTILADPLGDGENCQTWVKNRLSACRITCIREKERK